MKTLIIAAGLLLCAPAFAQSPTTTGDKDATPAETPDRPAAGAGATRSDERFTHGESKRCEKLAGDEKALCDKEEATKSQGENAEDLSKSAAPSRPARQ